jgi:hypothetical protein
MNGGLVGSCNRCPPGLVLPINKVNNIKSRHKENSMTRQDVGVLHSLVNFDLKIQIWGQHSHDFKHL